MHLHLKPDLVRKMNSDMFIVFKLCPAKHAIDRINSIST